jgi:transcriptional regulator with XRE-family HTH domain
MAKKAKKSGLRLEAVLKEKGITKYRLAKLLGKPTSNISVFFRADYDPRFSTIVSWAEAIGCKVRDLIDE